MGVNMKITKKMIAGAAALTVAACGFAQDWDDGFDSFDTASEPSFSINGSAEVTARAYFEASDITGMDKQGRFEYEDRPFFGEMKSEINPNGKLDLKYSGPNTDLNMKIKLNKYSLGDYKWDILDEFTACAYMGDFQLEAGKMRVVWGKGDKIHVLDNFNANDYTDYIIPDYLDRRIAETMFRAVYSTPTNLRFEAIYAPMMTADRLASSGLWIPKASRKLTSTVEEMLTTPISSSMAGGTVTPTTIGALMNASSFDSNSLYPDTYQLKYGQFGARSTFTIGSVDLGVSYYYGHNKQPSANVKKLYNATAAGVMNKTLDSILAIPEGDRGTSLGPEYAALTDAVIGMAKTELDRYEAELPELEYDKVHVFGLEAAFIAGPLNTRWEAAYTLTDDIDGDDPWVHNNSISWVAGFDFDVPHTNININIQENGRFVLNYDKIEDSEFSPFADTPLDSLSSKFKASYKEFDVDYNAKDSAWNNKLIVNVTDTFNHEKIKLDIKGIWGIERGDVLVMPSVTFNLKDDFNLTLSGLYIWTNNEESEFDGWERNSFAQIGCKYQF